MSALDVFFVELRAEMERLVGRPCTGFANWSAGAIFLVVNPDWRSFERHELAHLVTMGRWGRPAPGSRWMIEGLAVLCDGWCREYPVDQVAAALLAAEGLPPLQKLIDDYAGLGEIRAGFQAASVLGYVRERYGPEAVRRLWLEGPEGIEAVLGTGVSELDRAWREWLAGGAGAGVAGGGEVDLDAIEELGCG